MSPPGAATRCVPEPVDSPVDGPVGEGQRKKKHKAIFEFLKKRKEVEREALNRHKEDAKKNY